MVSGHLELQLIKSNIVLITYYYDLMPMRYFTRCFRLKYGGGELEWLSAQTKSKAKIIKNLGIWFAATLVVLLIHEILNNITGLKVFV